MMNKVIKSSAGYILALCIVSLQSACAQDTSHAPGPAANSFSVKPFPPTFSKYQARLFELIEPDEKRYEADFARQFRDLFASQTAKDRNIMARLTSGPTGVGTYLATNGGGYVHYSICQAHQCDTTTLDILFDPARAKMVGKLLDRCTTQWLGQPNDTEMQLLNQRQGTSHPATLTTCAGSK
jgi:hypothetical protein